jgi:hypothetical protein
MAVFADYSRPGKRKQFADHPALGVLVRKLKNRGAFLVSKRRDPTRTWLIVKASGFCSR